MRNKRWMMRGLVGAGLAALVVAGVTGCWWLINVAPMASFTASALSGTAPLTVNFSGILSSDEDGTIKKYEWDFGDGGSAVGEGVSHTFSAAGSFSVVLRVTDDDGATDTASQMITVLPAEDPGTGTGTGPSVSFTATPLTGQVPLTVTFNASATAYPGHSLTSYTWNFGDATTGTGITTTHTYGTAGTYTVVLTVIASDNTSRTANQSIIATSVPVTPPSANPTASFTVSPSTVRGPLKVTFDPTASSAASGRVIVTYIWTYGDGTAPTPIPAPTIQEHRFGTDQPFKNFNVNLTVIDDYGAAGSMTRAVRVENGVPVAGFQINDAIGGGGVWKSANVTFGPLVPVPQAVHFRSGSLIPAGWIITTPVPPADPVYHTGTPAGWVSNNFSYDPEGQGWTALPPPAFPSEAWGLKWLIWDFGDLSAQLLQLPAGGVFTDPVIHTYAFGGGSATYTVKITAVDHFGASTSFTRTITLH